MNGVTLISCISLEAVVAVVETHAHGVYSAAVRTAAIRRTLVESATIEIAADDAQNLGRGIGMQRAIAGDPARKHVVHHHGGDGRHQAERGCQQRLGDAGRHHREIGGVRFRDADEAVHDAPHRAEQSDEGRGGADGREQAGAADHLPAGGRFDALQPRGDAFLHAGRRQRSADSRNSASAARSIAAAPLLALQSRDGIVQASALASSAAIACRRRRRATRIRSPWRTRWSRSAARQRQGPPSPL